MSGEVASDPIRRGLAGLRDLVGRVGDEELVAFHAVSAELTGGVEKSVALTRTEKNAVEDLREALSVDPRFEHLGDEAKARVVDFLARVQLEPDIDQVERFFEENVVEPTSRTCFYGVESLTLKESFEIAGVRLTPTVEVEPASVGASFSSEIKTLVAVPVRGSDLSRMAARARERAEHALRILRISLRAERFINSYQLRFRLGDVHTFDSGQGAWEMPPDTSLELEVEERLLAVASDGPLWDAPFEPANKVERRIDRAMKWMDQAFLVGDPLLELLFYFFALEAILGDKSEKLKSYPIAFRRALLGSVTRDRFADPDRVAVLYDRVRSAAVHGSEPPPVDESLLKAFAFDTRWAVVEYATFAKSHGLTKPGKFFTRLESDPRRGRLIEGLRRRGAKDWTPFLDGLEGR